MAVKKNVASKTGGAASAAKKPPVASGTTIKLGTPDPATRPRAAAKAKKAAPTKEAAPIRLTDRQRDFLKTISAAKDEGYTAARKAEQKTIDALLDRKLIKRGAKDRQSGSYRYRVSKAGEKHLATLSMNP